MFKIFSRSFILCVLVISSNANSSSIKQLEFDQLVSQSELVFKGKVTAVSAAWNANQTEIFTTVSFTIDEIINGSFSSPTIELDFVGGTVNGETVTIEGSKMPAINESGIYFVSSTTQTLVNPIVGWAQGHYIMQKDSNGVERLMTQSKQPIKSINIEPARKSYLSEGMIAGVEEGSLGKIDEAMSADSFKQLIRARAQELKQRKNSASK